MRKHEFEELDRIVSSLSSSRSISFYYDGVKASVEKRHSPYKSHVGIKFEECDPAIGGLLIENDIYRIALAVNNITDSTRYELTRDFLYETTLVQEKIPARSVIHLIKQACDAMLLPNIYLEQIGALVYVEFPILKACGFEDGKPLFRYIEFNSPDDPRLEYESAASIELKCKIIDGGSFPELDPIYDGEWHYVATPHRYKGITFIGFYRSTGYRLNDLSLTEAIAHGFRFRYVELDCANAPTLSPVKDRKWHYVATPHRYLCTTGIGWYKYEGD